MEYLVIFFSSFERLHCRAARLIFNLPTTSFPGTFPGNEVDLPKDMASVDVPQRAQWPTLSIYYKSANFICFHKAFHDRLPVTFIDLISKKRATNYSTSLYMQGAINIYFDFCEGLPGPVLGLARPVVRSVGGTLA